DLADALEVDVAGALGQLLDDGRGEDLAAARLAGDARSDDAGLAVEVRLLADRLPGMDPDAHLDRPVGMAAQITRDGFADRLRALDRAPCARERDHEAVALRLDL